MNPQSWALAVFFIFSLMKNDVFCIFYQVKMTRGRLLNRIGTKIGYRE